MVALLPCLDHAQTALNLCRFLSVRDAHTEARGQRPNFRAHFNLWWARHGWYRIHLVSRLDSLFSRPPYFTAGVNLTAESAIEPPRGGEHGAGDYCLNRNSPFAESRNWQDYSLREPQTMIKETPLALGEPNSARMRGIFPYIAS